MNDCSRSAATAPFGRAVLLLFVLLVPTGGARAQSHDVSLGPLALLSEEVAAVGVGLGAFDVARENRALSAGPAMIGDLELRLGRKLLYLSPLAGLMANHQGGVYGYAGLYFDVALDRTQRWRLSPLLAAGGYREGQSKYLGGIFAFQLGGTVGYRFDSGSTFGLRVVHISNAFLYSKDPGVESILLTFVVPLEGLLGSSR